LSQAGDETRAFGADRVTEPFANQNAPIKVLRFEGVYAFATSISHRFLSIFRELIGSSLSGRGASVRYC